MIAIRRACARAGGLWLVVLTGCATQQAPGSAPTAVPQKAATALRNTGLAELAARQRLVAEAAERQGQWAEAVWAWDVLLALAPLDAELFRRRGLAQAGIDAGVAERLPRARMALQRGDTEAASRLFLEVLALLPGQLDAAHALRTLERDRVKRLHVGQLSRNAMLRRGTDVSATAMHLASGNSGPGAAGASGGRNEMEHASLLAAQGENAAAIAVLTPVVAYTPVDLGAKRLLADLHYRQAEIMAAGNRTAAMASLQRSLQLDPSHARAATRLKQLQAIRAP